MENSIIDLSNTSESLICEKELPSLLENYESQAMKLIEKCDYHNALLQFKRIEEIMENISAQGGTMNNEFIISTMQNIAFCYQE